MAVQAGHALAAWLLQTQNHDSWKNGTLIYKRVKNLDHLDYWQNKLEQRKIPFAVFNEPDLGNQATALATVGNGKMFKGLKLM
jgi:hypothetical protein